jgi:hypothetical protein
MNNVLKITTNISDILKTNYSENDEEIPRYNMFSVKKQRTM